LDLVGKYKIEQFPPNRRFIIDGLAVGANKHVIYGLLEFDITLARPQIREFRRKKGQPCSQSIHVRGLIRNKQQPTYSNNRF
jgi:hypothetical protein